MKKSTKTTTKTAKPAFVPPLPHFNPKNLNTGFKPSGRFQTINRGRR